jgi:hypothetical protein
LGGSAPARRRGSSGHQDAPLAATRATGGRRPLRAARRA